jgi:hypothetical protein
VPRWRDAALFSNSTIVATVEELEELSERIMSAVRPFLMSNRPLEAAPEDARRVHVALRMAPELPPDGGEAPAR